MRVLGKRADNFHEICTTFQTISLCDYLTFEAADKISLTCDVAGVPVDETNIIWRAANILREKFAVSRGAKIHLEKRIPAPGGLGGGSSDAAVTLLALNHLWGIKASLQELKEIAQTLGADVPFFLIGGTVFATGTGTETETLPDLPKNRLLVITPNEAVSTAEAYQNLAAPRLTALNPLVILTLCRLARIDCLNNQTIVQNDFEKSVFASKPEIERVKNKLLEVGAKWSLMSGSGASVFGIFDNKMKWQTAFDSLRMAEKDWRIFPCETISQTEYRQALSPCWD